MLEYIMNSNSNNKSDTKKINPTSNTEVKKEQSKEPSKEQVKEPSKEQSKKDEMSDEVTVDNNDSFRLLKKYDNFVKILDYRNMLYYGALFKTLFKDFKSEENPEGTIDKSIEELGKLLEKACDKLNFDIQNASIKQIIKLYSLLMDKLGGSKKLNQLDLETSEILLSRMYNDEEVLDLLTELEDNKINPKNIMGISQNDEIIFSNNTLQKLIPSSKFDELTLFYQEINNMKK